MPEPIRLSPHFDLLELTDTEQREFISENYRAAERDPRVLSALKSLCAEILEPIRAHFDAPLSVHSGYRMPELNAKVGGQPGSQHQLGEAADFHIVGMRSPEGLRTVWDWIRQESGLPFGQVILEGRPARWIHVSLGEPFRDPRKCRQALIALPDGKGGMRYEVVS